MMDETGQDTSRLPPVEDKSSNKQTPQNNITMDNAKAEVAAESSLQEYAKENTYSESRAINVICSNDLHSDREYEHVEPELSIPSRGGTLSTSDRQTDTDSVASKTSKKMYMKEKHISPAKTLTKKFRKLQSESPRNDQRTPQKSLKSPPKRQKTKGSAQKRKMPDDDSAEAPECKSRKLQGNKSGNGEAVDEDEDGWEDADSDDGDDINEILEKKAAKMKMTAKNVKSVLHHVLTNEHVLNMFNDALVSEGAGTSSETPSPSKSSDKLDCIPKMTRAKVKDFLEKLCMPSPLKTAKDGPSILDLEFNEEEDDDEYNPENDIECHESDDESIASSKLSELGSPYPPTPTTPIVRSVTDCIDSDASKEVPSTSGACSSSSAKNLETVFNAIAGPSQSEKVDGVDTIALRTRSKLPLTSTSITEIESAFVAPDITADMYDTHCDDADWVQFLSSLYKTADDTITDDDGDANDPEFNYIAEMERETPDKEDFRFDKPAQITKKELNSLLNELNELFEDEVLPYQVVASVPDVVSLSPSHPRGQNVMSGPTSPFAVFKTPQAPPKQVRVKNTYFEHSQVPLTQQQEEQLLLQQHHQQPQQQQQLGGGGDADGNSVQETRDDNVTPEQRALIEDNMRKHIQLLAQSFMLFSDHPSREDLTDPKSLLTELNQFRQASPAGVNSVYNVCNLDPALELISDPAVSEVSASQERPHVLSWKNIKPHTEEPCALSLAQKMAIYNSPAFVYPQLLPTLKSFKVKEKKYNKFLHSEDNLLALGLEQFQYCRDVKPEDLIYQLLIRGKNRSQIHNRILFLASYKSNDNAVKCVRKTGKLPENFPKPSVDRYYPRAPKDQIRELLPTWCLGLRETRKKATQSKGSVSEGSAPNTNGSGTVKQQDRMKANPVPVMQSTPNSHSSQKDRGAQKQSQITASHQVTPRPVAPILPKSTPMQIQDVNLGAPTLVLQKNMPPITGIFIQFAPPVATPVSSQSLGVKTLITPTSASASTLKERRSKRKMTSPASARRSKKPMINASTGQDTPIHAGLDTSNSNIASTPVEESASPDILARTMMSCGIQESPAPSSPPSPIPEDSNLHQINESPPSVAPVPRDKHPTVRNLNKEFDAADQPAPSLDETSPQLQHPASDIHSSSKINSKDVSLTSQESQSNTAPEEGSDKVNSPKEALAVGLTAMNNSQELMSEQAQIADPTSDTSGSSLLPDSKSCHTQLEAEGNNQVNGCNAGEPDKVQPSVSETLASKSDQVKDKENVLSAPDQIETFDMSAADDGSEKSVTQGEPHTDKSDVMDTDSPLPPLETQNNQHTKECDENLHSQETNTTTEENVKKPVTIEDILARNAKSLDNAPKSKSIKDILEAARTIENLEGSKANILYSDKATSGDESGSENLNIDLSRDINSSWSECDRPSPTAKSSPQVPIHKQSVPPASDKSSVQEEEKISAASSDGTITLVAVPSPVKFHDTSTLVMATCKTPTKLRPLAPKVLSPSAHRSPGYVPLPKVSPKRKELNKQVRQILPKSFVFETKSVSPTKAAALILKKKATMVCQHRSPVKILPKQPQTVSPRAAKAHPLFTPTRMFTRSQKPKARSKTAEDTRTSEGDISPEEEEASQDREKDAGESEMSEIEDACLSQEDEDDDEEFEDDDQSQLDDLMAACTTIKYDPKKGSNVDNDTKSKAQKKKELCLSLLEPDILEGDPKKDERDTAYAQQYFNHVKQVLQDDPKRFKKFLTILHDLNKDHTNPTELWGIDIRSRDKDSVQEIIKEEYFGAMNYMQLYADMASLLSDHQDLVDDFAGFLLAYQAVECGCFVSHFEYQQIRTFLRQLEIYCDTSTLTFQRTLKMMSRWLALNQEAQADATSFKDRIGAVLRHVPSLMDDLMSYFYDGRLPDSHPTDFEQIDLADDELDEMDEFEEVTLPETREEYNTKLCRCQCHQDTQDEKMRKRIKHCFSCSLKLYDGEPVLNISRNTYHPIDVIYPLEEKEKMMKAKKEAAQLALAKARAQRRQKRKGKKKRDVGKLKGKGSKKVPLKKKIKKKKTTKEQTENDVKPNLKSDCKELDIRRASEDGGAISGSQEELELHEDIKPGHEVIDRIVSRHSRTVQDSGKFQHLSEKKAVPEMFSSNPHLDAEGASLGFDTEIAGGHDETSGMDAGVSSRETPIPSPSSVTSKANTTTLNSKTISLTITCRQDVISPSSSVSDVGCGASSITKSSAITENSAGAVPMETSLTTVASSTNLGSHVTVNTGAGARKSSQPKRKLSQSRTTQPMTSLAQLLSAPIQSHLTSALTPRMPGSLPCTPVVSSSQAYHLSPAIPSLSSAARLMVSSAVSTLPTMMSGTGYRPAFSTPLQMTTARIPVMISLCPQQFLPSHTTATTTTDKLNKSSVRKSQTQSSAKSAAASQHSVTKALKGSQPHPITREHPDNRDGVSADGQNSAEVTEGPNKNGTYAVCHETSVNLQRQDRCPEISSDVPMAEDIPSEHIQAEESLPFSAHQYSSQIPSLSITDAEPSSSASSCTTFTNSHASFTAAGSSVDSRLNIRGADFPSETTSDPLTSVEREKIPGRTVHAHLENFSLGGYDESLGLTHIQHLAHTISPSKMLGDSVSKFDLLSYIDSSNLTCKDLAGTVGTAAPISSASAEPLLSFSGALSRASTSVAGPASSASLSYGVHGSSEASTHDGSRDLPTVHFQSEEVESGQAVHKQTPYSDPVTDKAERVTRTDDQPSVGGDAEMSVWTEEWDRSILNVVTEEGLTETAVKRIQPRIPGKSCEEISSRASQLLQMLQDIGDSESDTGTEASQDDLSGQEM